MRHYIELELWDYERLVAFAKGGQKTEKRAQYCCEEILKILVPEEREETDE